MMEAMKWNKENITALLRTNDRAVERAMVVLLERQTRDEQYCENTAHSNQRGFNCAHAKRGTYYGKWVRSGRYLTGTHLERARSIALRYTQQLADQANENIAKSS